MKSLPPDAGPPNPGEEKSAEAEMSLEAEKTPVTKEQSASETEKDSGYSDSSSESISSEDTSPSTTGSVTAATPDTPQTAYTPIYILQNVILKQSRLVLLQSPVRRHRKRASPSSYLPILRSYPRIAPRIAPTPSSVASEPFKDTAPAPPDPQVCKRAAPQLLEVSLRSMALLRRTRETQRSIRELRIHTRLYERALQGEDGGWERLRRAMERSGGYRKIPPAATDSDRMEEAMNTTEASTATKDEDSAEMTEEEEEVTSPEEAMTSSEAAPSACDAGGAV